ncbi:hypothetical protein AKJ35_00385 [candidate division MSBL1 archaeon SCGC-AAA833F18]|uniref:CAAX prenyl protease 2/Lysostaphin resistance protein A-like domain-containing protein n=4 Tax=candidate division MSBL1 TaxID=215777 RepID=A0A133V4Q8_9EURY|nr:hypothetical protein AKJ44_02540 [candidate division MSBL1 archaeon SCGC-AAA261F17]KXB03766.1 hypothetical protein AKJ47_01685 [candidate division MSBL1 archaeon SCGC-AAA261G05]KXB04759.1 hypothetical protein AKJ48_01505 [candidate division MSBL1 archaeon SCGC-AAA261O19]KXB09603.1 hypothetical protein AKJ35_00385 [candidate division MSBL1 archaeon SCGC-AAA833F18]
MGKRTVSKHDIIELGVLFATLAIVTIMAFYTPLKIEWVWRAPQLLVPFAILLVHHKSVKSIGLDVRNFPQNMGLGILAAILLTVGLAPIYLWLWSPTMPTSLYLDVWAWVTIFVIANALVIEIFYRGGLQSRLTKLTGFMPALIITSLLCGIDFFEFMIFGPITAVIAAAVSGFLYYKTETLVAPITAHILWPLLIMMLVV